MSADKFSKRCGLIRRAAYMRSVDQSSLKVDGKLSVS